MLVSNLITDTRLMSVLTVAMVSMILVISQSHSAFASVEDDIRSLTNDVEELIDNGEIEVSEKKGQLLLEKLENAAIKADSGNEKAAKAGLNNFIKKIDQFIKAESISFTNGQSLINAAETIIYNIEH